MTIGLALGLTAAPAIAADEAVERAVAELKSGDWILQYRAIRRISAAGGPQAETLLEGVLRGKHHPWLQGRALVELARLRGTKAVALAVDAARSAQPEFRAAAVEALGTIGSPEGEAVVAAALKDKAPLVRRQAVLAIARLRKARAWPLIQPLLAEEDASLLPVVARALRDVGSPEALAELARLAAHKDETVRTAAVQSLGRFPSAEHAALLLTAAAKDRRSDVRARAADALASFPPEVLRPALLANLRAGDNDTHAAAMAVLSRKPDPRTAAEIARLLQSPPKAYGSALGAMVAYLGLADPDRYHDVLVKHLGHEWTNVREAAIRAVGHCRTADRFGPLKPLTADENLGIRACAIDALHKHAGGASPPEGWLRYLADALATGPDTRRRCLLLLADRLKAPELAQNFEAVASTLGCDHEYIRNLAAQTLGKIADEPTRLRIAGALGYVTSWKVVGPFPNDTENRGFDVIYPPEAKPDPDANYPAFAFARGAIFETTAHAGGRPDGFRIGPPTEGPRQRTVVTFHVPVPAGGAKLAMKASVPAGDGADGEKPAAILRVTADGQDVLAETLFEAGDANTLELPLPAPAAGTCALEFLVAAAASGKAARVEIARPRVVDSTGKAIAFAPLARTAAARTEPVGRLPERIAWAPQHVAGASGQLALHDVFTPPTNYRVAYASATLTAEAERDVVLEIEADDACIVWLNGTEVHRASERQAVKVPAALPAGPNRLLVKCANRTEWWFVRVRVAAKDGRRAPGIRIGGDK